MTIRLTAKQQDVLDFIKSMVEAKGYPPTRAEITAHFGWKSENSAESHIFWLRKKGAITTAPGISRNISVVDHNRRIGFACPHCGGHMEKVL